jgi:hypothetical protein
MAFLAKARQALLFLAALAFLAGSAHAGERIWVGLFLGESRVTDEHPQAPPALAARLHEVFGFANYSLLKQETIDLGRNPDHWVLSRKDFFLRLQPMLTPEGTPTRLHYEIYKDGFLVANGTYVAAADLPLFISGPDLNHGRLIYVLEPR